MNTEINNPYSRLEIIMGKLELNLNSLANSIGLKRTQNLYDIRDGKIKNIQYKSKKEENILGKLK